MVSPVSFCLLVCSYSLSSLCLLKCILFTCCKQFLMYCCILSKNGVIFSPFAISDLQSVQVYPAVSLTYLISSAVLLLASLALLVQISLQNNSGPFHRRLVLTSGPFHRRLVLTSAPFHRHPVLQRGPSLRIPEFCIHLSSVPTRLGDPHNIPIILTVTRNWNPTVSNKLVDVSDTLGAPAYHTE
jgi:hypothetical protein